MKIFTRYRILIGASVLLLALLGLAPTEHRSSAATLPAAIDLPQQAACQLTPQMAPVPFHVEARAIQSGRHTATRAEGTQVAFSTLVQSLDAPWLQIQFGETELGRSSYLRLTALSGGAVQELDAETLAAWNNQSAMFRGDTVKIELIAAPEDQDTFFEVRSVIVGEWVGGVPLRSSRPSVPQWESPSTNELDVTRFKPDSVCGTDDRAAANDLAVGRIMPVGCTGWVISNGAFLTAGHCNTGSMTTIHFNVPASNADGTTNPPPPNDQYPIDAASIISMDNGNHDGNDWAVFRVNPNITTTLTPPLRYGAFYRILPQAEPTTVRVTGYGVDGPAPCFGSAAQPDCTDPAPPRNADNQTLQTHAGPGEGRTGTHFEYRVDTQGGNSGSPVRSPDSRLAVAIHTHGNGDAACSTDFNGGTAFTNVELAAAINNFPSTNVRYVDEGYPPWTAEDGTVFRPFNLVAEGINTVAAGGIVSIVTGDYNEPMTINKQVILEAPVGTVLIGAP